MDRLVSWEPDREALLADLNAARRCCAELEQAVTEAQQTRAALAESKEKYRIFGLPAGTALTNDRKEVDDALHAHTQQLDALRALNVEIIRELDVSTLLHLRKVQLRSMAAGLGSLESASFRLTVSPFLDTSRIVLYRLHKTIRSE